MLYCSKGSPSQGSFVSPFSYLLLISKSGWVSSLKFFFPPNLSLFFCQYYHYLQVIHFLKHNYLCSFQFIKQKQKKKNRKLPIKSPKDSFSFHLFQAIIISHHLVLYCFVTELTSSVPQQFSPGLLRHPKLGSLLFTPSFFHSFPQASHWKTDLPASRFCLLCFPLSVTYTMKVSSFSWADHAL